MRLIAPISVFMVCLPADEEMRARLWCVIFQSAREALARLLALCASCLWHDCKLSEGGAAESEDEQLVLVPTRTPQADSVDTKRLQSVCANNHIHSTSGWALAGTPMPSCSNALCQALQ
jgi:hypothetical protein